MSVDDPFSVVRGEVQKALNTSRGLYQRWCELLQEANATSVEEFDWTTNELRNSLRSIEWDLEDLEETISIVESAPKKFKITPAELSERRNFVEKTRSSLKLCTACRGKIMEEVQAGTRVEVDGDLKEMRDHISSPRAQAFTENKKREALGVSHPTDRFARLDDEMITGNSRYIEDQQAQQQLIMDEQDAELDMVSGSIRVLKDMSGRIGDELEEQSIMLDHFSHEMDNTHNRMDSVLKRLAKVSHMTSDRRQWCVIGVLLVVLVIVVILLIEL